MMAGGVRPSGSADLKTTYFTAASPDVFAGLSVANPIVVHSRDEGVFPSLGVEPGIIIGVATTVPIAEEVCRKKLRRLIAIVAGFILVILDHPKVFGGVSMPQLFVPDARISPQAFSGWAPSEWGQGFRQISHYR